LVETPGNSDTQTDGTELNNDVAREKIKQEDDRRAIVSSKLVSVFGFTQEQADEATSSDRMDCADAWLDVGLPEGRGTGWVVNAIRNRWKPGMRPRAELVRPQLDLTGLAASGLPFHEFVKSRAEACA
jgi:hypothetical protein